MDPGSRVYQSPHRLDCIVNSSNVQLTEDSPFAVYSGSVEIGGDAPNRLDTTEGGNFPMRIRRLGKSVQFGLVVILSIMLPVDPFG